MPEDENQIPLEVWDDEKFERETLAYLAALEDLHDEEEAESKRRKKALDKIKKIKVDLKAQESMLQKQSRARHPSGV